MLAALTLTFVVLALAATWVVVRGLQARSELAAAQRQLPALRSEIVQGDTAAATRSLAALTEETSRARGLTDDPVWSAFAHLPLVGGSLRTSSGLAAASADLAQNVLPALVRAGQQLDPAHLRSGATIELQPFVDALPALNQAATQSRAVFTQINALPSSGLVGQVARARASLLAQLTTLVSSTGTAAIAAALAPDMLGAHGPRTYFLAFQNNAEARGTGGLMGAFGVAVADKGTITVTRTGSDSQLSQYARPVISLGAEYDGIYGASAETDLREANLSPHFPDAATIWAAMWQRQSKHPVDGVLALDPVAMAGILDATGPATLSDGTRVTGANVVQLTEQRAYDQFTDPQVRKQFLQLVAHAVVGQLMTGGGSPKALLTGLGSAVGARHLRLWSAHADEQARLATLPIAGELTSTPGPYAQLVVNNAAGGKLDYYLGRSLTYTAGPCTTGLRDSTISVTLTNGAPSSGLSAYALTRADKPAHAYPPGQNRTLVSVYAALGARLTSATLDGRPVAMQATTERGHPRFSRYLELDPASSGTLVLHLEEPTVAGGATVPFQPLVIPQVTHVSVSECR
ncbi:hypothetical protein acdb102_10890 [Acidothermaceae bacterium B102]|nr:hypothetical protein acdb102_10890 [Acidothermaceae bacterium B102]